MKVTSTLNEGFVNELPPAGRFGYYPSWIQPTAADQLLDRLINDLEWQSRTIQFFGRRMLQPRLIDFQGDAGVCYRYSGDDYLANRWHPEVRALRDRLQAFVVDFLRSIQPQPEHGLQFNSVLINRYRHGQDSMGWHADNEKSLGQNPVIASISLGAVRRFMLRRHLSPGENRDGKREQFVIEPEHGSLIVMAGDLQHQWQHQLPKTKKPVGERINLTFRTVRQ